MLDGPTAEREEVGLLMATGRRQVETAGAAGAPIETIRMDADTDAGGSTPE
jgi:hypothetical protein